MKLFVRSALFSFCCSRQRVVRRWPSLAHTMIHGSVKVARIILIQFMRFRIA
jgi:hypothetical protein